MDAEQRLAREGPAEPVAQEPVERADAERPHRQPLDALGAERLLEPRRLRSVADPPGEQQDARGSPSSRRNANASALAEDGSSHWTSSIATSSGSPSLSSCSALRIAIPSARGSTAISRRLLEQERDLERAPPRRRQRGQDLVEDVLEQIAQPHVSEAALSLGRSRREDAQARARACSTPASQSVDLPIPASPSSTSAAGPPSAWPTKAWREASSSSLPTISNGMCHWGIVTEATTTAGSSVEPRRRTL